MGRKNKQTKKRVKDSKLKTQIIVFTALLLVAGIYIGFRGLQSKAPHVYKEIPKEGPIRNSRVKPNNTPKANLYSTKNIKDFLRQEKYAYAKIKVDDLEGRLVRQVALFGKLNPEKNSQNIMAEFMGKKYSKFLITDSNSKEFRQKLHDHFKNFVENKSYIERKELCKSNGGSYQGRKVDKDFATYLRTCICLNSNAALRGKPWAYGQVLSISCE